MTDNAGHKDVSEYFYNDPEKGKKYQKKIKQALDPHEHQHRGLFVKSDKKEGREERENGP